MLVFFFMFSASFSSCRCNGDVVRVVLVITQVELNMYIVLIFEFYTGFRENYNQPLKVTLLQLLSLIYLFLVWCQQLQ